jgi:hypothetical protein
MVRDQCREYTSRHSTGQLLNTGDTNATRGNAPWTTRHNTGIPTPGICWDCRICNPETSAGCTAHQTHGMGGLSGAGAPGLAGGAQTPQQQGMQGTQGGLVAGTMAMTTAGGGKQAITRQARQPGSGGAGAHGQWTPAEAGPPRAGYFGIGTYLKKLGPYILDPGTVLSMLQWLNDANRDAACINTFKAKVGSLLTFQAFLMMREGSAMVMVLHSPAEYFATTAATLRYQGRFIGFVGNRLPMRELGPVLIQATKYWEWVKKPIRADGDVLMQAYGAQLDVYGKLWLPPADGSKVEKAVPHLLVIPSLFLKLIREQNKSLMPHEVWTIVKAYLGSHGLPQEVAAACKFEMVRCLVAAQASGANKDSHVAFGLDAVTDQEQDTSLARWLDQRINTTLGQWPVLEGSQAQAGAILSYHEGHAVDADIITWAVGQGLAFGCQHLLPQGGVHTPTQGEESTSKTSNLGFSANNVTAVMSYSGIEDLEDSLTIRTIFADKRKM